MCRTGRSGNEKGEWMMWMNLGSLILGLAAWCLPVAAIARGRFTALWCTASLSACALSLGLVVFYLGHLVELGDWSALMDTVGVFRLCAAALLVGTLFLNSLAVLCGHGARRA